MDNKEPCLKINIHTNTDGNEIAASVFSCLLLVLTFVRLSYEDSFNFLKLPMLVLSMALWCVLLLRKNVMKAEIVIVAVMGLSSIINYFFVGNQNLFEIIKIYAINLAVAYCILSFEKLSKFIWIPTIAILWVYVLIAYANSADGYQLFYGTSRNYVSIYSLYFIFLITVVLNKSGKSLPFWVCIVGFLISIYAIGRGGIISTALLIMLFGIKEIRNEKNYKIILLGMAVLVSVVIMLEIDASSFDKLANTMFSRFLDRDAIGSNNERMIIYRSYIHDASRKPFNLLFGVNTNDINMIISEKKGNVHNSFLQFHACFGLIPLITLVYCLINTTRCLLKYRMTDQLFVMLAFLVRCGTDYVFPAEVGDVVIWYYVLLPYTLEVQQSSTAFSLGLLLREGHNNG